jgi:hypothetical protein
MSLRTRCHVAGWLIAASGLVMIVVTFVPWFKNASSDIAGIFGRSFPVGDVSGWDLFRKFGVTYDGSYYLPDDGGTVVSWLFTGIVTLVVGIAGVVLGALVGTRFDGTRGASWAHSGRARITILLVGLVVGLIEAVLLFQQLFMAGTGLESSGTWTPFWMMFAAFVLLLTGMILAVRTARRVRLTTAEKAQQAAP